MSSHFTPRSLLPHTILERKVEGLREAEAPSDIRVFKANPDGTIGELLRIEHMADYHPYFDKRHNYKKEQV